MFVLFSCWSHHFITQWYNFCSILEQWQKKGKLTKGTFPICTGRYDAFEIIFELLKIVILCLDGLNNINVSWNNFIAGCWNNFIAGWAFVLCSALPVFILIIALLLHKTVLFLKRAFGKNLQDHTINIFFAAGSLIIELNYMKRWKIFMVSTTFDLRKPRIWHQTWYLNEISWEITQVEQDNQGSQLTIENYKEILQQRSTLFSILKIFCYNSTS